MLGPDLIIHNIGEFEAIHSKPAYQTTAIYAIESIDSIVEDGIRRIGHHGLRSLTFVLQSSNMRELKLGVGTWDGLNSDSRMSRYDCHRFVECSVAIMSPENIVRVFTRSFPGNCEKAKPRPKIHALVIVHDASSIINQIYIIDA
jgi:hypothetical protein